MLIFFVLATLYFTSSYLSNQQASLTRRDLRYSSTPSQAIKTLDRVVLTRDQKFVIGWNCLVYKGIENKTVVLDLYLLDMDREQAYEKRFPKKEAKKEMKLGGDSFLGRSGKDRYMTLKIVRTSASP